jgi:2-dehydro-3-deoxygalactonokinase
MRWAEGFIAADWGTTNRRAYLVSGEGRCVDEMEDAKGVLSVPAGGFGDAVREIRARLGDKPLLLAGMIGSNRGWVEAPYGPCPAGIEEIARALAWPEDRTAIVPGVSWRDGDDADVMRGEETQILGALAAGLIAPEALVCHPGTHNKWVRLEGGRITRFTTVMTGEMFNLLKEHSILADQLRERSEANEAFERGVRKALWGAAITSELFTIRARFALGERTADGSSYASGLLIGADIGAGLALAEAATQPVLIGRPDLTRLYAAALAIAGREAAEVDGEEAFLAGAKKIVELIDERR